MTLTTLMGAALCATGPGVGQSSDCTAGRTSIDEQAVHETASSESDGFMLRSLIPDTEFVVRYGHRNRHSQTVSIAHSEVKALVNFRWDLGKERVYIADSFLGLDPSLGGDDCGEPSEWESHVFDCLDHIERTRLFLEGSR